MRTDRLLPSSLPPSSLTHLLYIWALSFYSFYYISLSLYSECVCVCVYEAWECDSSQGPVLFSPVAGLPIRPSVRPCVCLGEILRGCRRRQKPKEATLPSHCSSCRCRSLCKAGLGFSGFWDSVCCCQGREPAVQDSAVLIGRKQWLLFICFSLLFPLSPQTGDAKSSSIIPVSVREWQLGCRTCPTLAPTCTPLQGTCGASPGDNPVLAWAGPGYSCSYRSAQLPGWLLATP